MLTWLLTYSIISVILLKDLTSTSEALSLVSCSASFWTPLFLTLELIVTDVMWVKWEKYKSEYGTFERKSICCCVWLLWLSFLFQVALRKTQHHCQPQIWVWPDINCLETISNTSLNLPPQKVFPVYGQFFLTLAINAWLLESTVWTQSQETNTNIHSRLVRRAGTGTISLSQRFNQSSECG